MVLCRGEFAWISPEHVAPLLEEMFPPETIQAALSKRPLTIDEGAELFGRDVSPDASKGVEKVMRELRCFYLNRTS